MSARRARLVHESDERVGDKVDRNDVGAPGVGQHHRGHTGQSCQLGQYAEEVVGTVDLVHLAGARVADDDRRPVDPIPQALRGADQHFGFELRLVIRRRQILRDIEVVLGELAAVRAGNGDRGHVVQRRIEAKGQVDDSAGAVDIGRALLGVGDGDVVDSRTVHDVVDGAEFVDGFVGQPQIGCSQVTDQWFCSLSPWALALGGQPLEPFERLAADQDPHLGVLVAGQNLGHDASANKPGTAGNDIAHASHGHPWREKGQWLDRRLAGGAVYGPTHQRREPRCRSTRMP